MAPERNGGEWVFCGAEVAGAVATFREREGITSIVERSRADELRIPYSYVAAWITLTIDSDLEAVGFLAAVTGALAAAAISCNVVSALHHDHLFVPAPRAEEAMHILRQLSCSTSTSTPPTSASGS